jgi:hypothetical protein
VIFKQVSAELARQCDLLGVRRRKFDGVIVSPYLFLVPTVPSFEYPRTDLPPVVHFIGALLPDAAAAFTPPPGGAKSSKNAIRSSCLRRARWPPMRAIWSPRRSRRWRTACPAHSG